MKYLSALMIASLIGLAHGYDVRVVGRTIQTNKYTFNGKAVWDDAEKATMMVSHTSSSPIRSSDFQPVTVPANEQSIIDDLNDGKEYATRTKVLKEITRQKKAEYVNDKAKLNALGLSKSAVRRLLK